MKFKDFQAPVLFLGTFKALNLGEKNQLLSRMRGNPVTDVRSRKSVQVKTSDRSLINKYVFLVVKNVTSLQKNTVTFGCSCRLNNQSINGASSNLRSVVTLQVTNHTSLQASN